MRKYFGMTKKKLKIVGIKTRFPVQLLVQIYALFENYYNGIENKEEDKNSVEYGYFENFINDHQELVPYRTE